MLHGFLDDPSTSEPLRMNPTWRLALSWLASIPSDIAVGRYNLYGQSMFALVQEYQTQPREQCRFESHREHVDLQFTLSGIESIDWCPRSQLKPDGDFSLDHDVGFWLPPTEPVTSLVQSPRRFAVFYPEDAHRPKVNTTTPEKVRKLVIKVPVKMLR